MEVDLISLSFGLYVNLFIVSICSDIWMQTCMDMWRYESDWLISVPDPVSDKFARRLYLRNVFPTSKWKSILIKDFIGQK